MLRRMFRPLRRLPLWAAFPVLAALFLEVLIHRSRYRVAPPSHPLDQPFFSGCQEPDVSAPREKAALVMLARNSELAGANQTAASIERQFNRWFRYPVVFMNDEPWDEEFMETLNRTTEGRAVFEVIPRHLWTFPVWIDPTEARQSIHEQGKARVPHAGQEGYHHMCRFYSGKFYNLDFLQQYKWYWRLEPSVDFSCAIPYDPFVQMARHGKIYGFSMALWEVGRSCPSLFRDVADWMAAQALPPTNLWRAMVSPSWVPFPFRRYLSWLPHRDRYGDEWSLCHYWSNFEIADMDFFRSNRYQSLFEYLDRKGGFYRERWGDAAVHSLAVAMFLHGSQVHHFSDVGYRHGSLYECPANAAGTQLPESKSLSSNEGESEEGRKGRDKDDDNDNEDDHDHDKTPWWSPETEGGVGCRCTCNATRRRNYPSDCLQRLMLPVSPERSWSTWFS